MHIAAPARAIAPIVVLVTLSLGGCQAARMPVPEPLAGAERMSVSGRQGFRLSPRLRFGVYEAQSIQRSWTRGRDRGATPVATHSERTQTYRFTLHEGEVARWFVACRAAVQSLRIDLRVVDMHPDDKSALYCNLQSTADRLTAWELELAERHGRPLAGTLTLGPSRLDVMGTDRVAGALSMGATTGYEIRSEGDVVGAVEVINRGAVWLRPDLDPERRSVLAAVATALLLFDDLYDTISN